MSKETKKVDEKELIFDLSKALIVIEKDKDLDDMFRSKYGTDYKICHALINSGSGMKPEASKYVKDVFDKVILESTRLSKVYKSLGDVKVELEELVEPVKGETKLNKKKRWGLRAITDDIKDSFNGKAKQVHKTGQKVQLLKKIFTRLEMRIFNERFNKKTLTDEQLRELGGAVETFNKKVDSILKPKK